MTLPIERETRFSLSPIVVPEAVHKVGSGLRVGQDQFWNALVSNVGSPVPVEELLSGFGSGSFYIGRSAAATDLAVSLKTLRQRLPEDWKIYSVGTPADRRGFCLMPKQKVGVEVVFPVDEAVVRQLTGENDDLNEMIVWAHAYTLGSTGVGVERWNPNLTSRERAMFDTLIANDMFVEESLLMQQGGLEAGEIKRVLKGLTDRLSFQKFGIASQLEVVKVEVPDKGNWYLMREVNANSRPGSSSTSLNSSNEQSAVDFESMIHLFPRLPFDRLVVVNVESDEYDARVVDDKATWTQMMEAWQKLRTTLSSQLEDMQKRAFGRGDMVNLSLKIDLLVKAIGEVGDLAEFAEVIERVVNDLNPLIVATGNMLKAGASEQFQPQEWANFLVQLKDKWKAELTAHVVKVIENRLEDSEVEETRSLMIQASLSDYAKLRTLVDRLTEVESRCRAIIETDVAMTQTERRSKIEEVKGRGHLREGVMSTVRTLDRVLVRGGAYAAGMLTSLRGYLESYMTLAQSMLLSRGDVRTEQLTLNAGKYGFEEVDVVVASVGEHSSTVVAIKVISDRYKVRNAGLAVLKDGMGQTLLVDGKPVIYYDAEIVRVLPNGDLVPVSLLRLDEKRE